MGKFDKLHYYEDHRFGFADLGDKLTYLDLLYLKIKYGGGKESEIREFNTKFNELHSTLEHILFKMLNV